MKLASKFSATPQNIIVNSGKDLKRKILSYLSTEKTRSAIALNNIIVEHFAHFDEFFDLRFVREEDVTLNDPKFMLEKTLRHCDILEQATFDLEFVAESSGVMEHWTGSYDFIRQEYTIEEHKAISTVANHKVKTTSRNYISSGIVLGIVMKRHIDNGESMYEQELYLHDKLFTRLCKYKDED